MTIDHPKLEHASLLSLTDRWFRSLMTKIPQSTAEDVKEAILLLPEQFQRHCEGQELSTVAQLRKHCLDLFTGKFAYPMYLNWLCNPLESFEDIDAAVTYFEDKIEELLEVAELEERKVEKEFVYRIGVNGLFRYVKNFDVEGYWEETHTYAPDFSAFGAWVKEKIADKIVSALNREPLSGSERCWRENPSLRTHGMGLAFPKSVAQPKSEAVLEAVPETESAPAPITEEKVPADEPVAEETTPNDPTPTPTESAPTESGISAVDEEPEAVVKGSSAEPEVVVRDTPPVKDLKGVTEEKEHLPPLAPERREIIAVESPKKTTYESDDGLEMKFSAKIGGKMFTIIMGPVAAQPPVALQVPVTVQVPVIVQE